MAEPTDYSKSPYYALGAIEGVVLELAKRGDLTPYGKDFLFAQFEVIRKALGDEQFGNQAVSLLYKVHEMYRTLNRTGWFEDEAWDYWTNAGGDEIGAQVEEFTCRHAASLWD
jgi:hypothetical protein